MHLQVCPGQGAISRTDKSKTRSRCSVPFRDWPHASAVPHHWQHGAAPSSEGILADKFSGPAEEEKKDIKSPAGVCDRAAAAAERLAAAERKIHDLDHYAQARDSEVARLSDQLQGAELNRRTQQQHLRHLEHTLRSTETALRDLEDRHRRERRAHAAPRAACVRPGGVQAACGLRGDECKEAGVGEWAQAAVVAIRLYARRAVCAFV